jgi:hypothetical protein
LLRKNIFLFFFLHFATSNFKNFFFTLLNINFFKSKKMAAAQVELEYRLREGIYDADDISSVIEGLIPANNNAETAVCWYQRCAFCVRAKLSIERLYVLNQDRRLRVRVKHIPIRESLVHRYIEAAENAFLNPSNVSDASYFIDFERKLLDILEEVVNIYNPETARF